MWEVMALICSLLTAEFPTSRELEPVPHTPPERVKGKQSLDILGSSSGTEIGKHGATFVHVESHIAPELKDMSLGVMGARSRSWSRNCPICQCEVHVGRRRKRRRCYN